MKSYNPYVHLLWMFLLIQGTANSQDAFKPQGYANSVKEALKEASSIYSVSVYYKQGGIYDIESGRTIPDEPFEKLPQLTQLKELRLNGKPQNFEPLKFFCNVSALKTLEVLELRMNFQTLGGVLNELQINCLKKLKSLKRLNLPHQYPWEDLQKLKVSLPHCEIVVNLYPEGE